MGTIQSYTDTAGWETLWSCWRGKKWGQGFWRRWRSSSTRSLWLNSQLAPKISFPGVYQRSWSMFSSICLQKTWSLLFWPTRSCMRWEGSPSSGLMLRWARSFWSLQWPLLLGVQVSITLASIGFKIYTVSLAFCIGLSRTKCAPLRMFNAKNALLNVSGNTAFWHDKQVWYYYYRFLAFPSFGKYCRSKDVPVPPQIQILDLDPQFLPHSLAVSHG